jgi:hypothetical protein
MSCTPPAARRPAIERNSATEWLTAVRCAIGTSVVSVATLAMLLIVPSRLDPPAP